jgi:uncharacterized protein YebE (UPF0316 family)
MVPALISGVSGGWLMPLLFGSTVPLAPALPLFVFLAEVCVVTVGTLRIIFVARGLKYLASLLGFFEVALWLFAIGQVMQNLSDLRCCTAFACGFTVGNFLGILIENKLALGTQVVRIITRRDASDLIETLRSAGYGVTSVEGQGTTGPVQIIFTVIRRKERRNVLTVIERFDSKAFCSVDNVQAVTAGVFSTAQRGARGIIPSIFSLRSAAENRETLHGPPLLCRKPISDRA